jgi:hypothetical protein
VSVVLSPRARRSAADDMLSGRHIHTIQDKMSRTLSNGKNHFFMAVRGERSNGVKPASNSRMQALLAKVI